MDFKNIEWGEDESRGDSNLAQYFVEIPAMQEIIEGQRRYIIGRKGSGKTAIAEKIRIDSRARHDWFYEDVSLKNFPLNEFRELGDNRYRDKSKYVEAWRFVICMTLVRLIRNDSSCYQQQSVRNISDFVERNFPGDDVGISRCITTLTEKKLKVSLKGITIGGTNSDTVLTDIHYSKTTKSLIDEIKGIQSENYYYVFFDELDEGYNVKDSSMRLILLALFRAIETLSIDLRDSGVRVRPLLLLRSDIFNKLHDNDLNKIDDYIVRLDWSEYSGSGCKLIDIVNARIRASLGTSVVWDDVVLNNDKDLPTPVESIWKYIINRTYERPRDVIKFLKYCKAECKGDELRFSQVELAENKYSNWFFNELKDEMCAHLSCYTDAVMALSTIGKSRFSYSDCADALARDISVSRYCADNTASIDEIIKLLFDFSVIGTIDVTKRWIFKYKDSDLPFKKGADIIIHFGLMKKLRARGKRW